MGAGDAPPVGCGTARAGPPIGSGRGPARIEAAAKARAVDMPAERRRPDRADSARPRRASATARSPALASGLPIRPVLKHGPRSLTCVRVNGRANPEHTCRDPKDGELCLSGAKPEETLVEARSDTDVQIVRLTWLVPSEVSLRIAGARARVLSGKAND
ncbi:UNVERIFIED_CONTAM: hypothetical protein Sindi_3105700 [Sesamum indicum]